MAAIKEPFLAYVAIALALTVNTAEIQANSTSGHNESAYPSIGPTAVPAPNNKLTAPTFEYCENLTTHSDPVVVRPLRKPPHMKLFRDPAFMTKNRRITNSLDGQVHRPLARSAQSWNSDESLLILQAYDTSGAVKYRLMDGSTYQQLGDLNISSAVDNAVFWSRENPLSVVYVANSDDKAGQLLRFDIATGTESLIKDFAPYCESRGLPASGGLFPKPSANDELFSFQCGIASGKSLAISYRYTSDDISTLDIGIGTQWSLDSPPQATASGSNFLFQGFSTDDTLQNKFVSIKQHNSKFEYHVSSDAKDNDVVYQLAATAKVNNCLTSDNLSPSTLQKYKLPTGECHSFLPQDNTYPLLDKGSTVFADAEHAPDWAVVSSIGYGELEKFAQDTPVPSYFSELFLVDTRHVDKQQICRIAHHRAFGKSAQNANYEVALGEPVITLSPSGTRVLFSSDWYDSGSVDTFVVELPAFTRLQLEGDWVDVQEPNRVTRFVQAGAKFAFSRASTTQDDSHTTSGTGSISGKQITLNYATMASDKKLSGTCTATVQRNIDNLLFNCDGDGDGDGDGDHWGPSGFNIMRQ